MEVQNFINLCSRNFEFKIPVAKPMPPLYNWKIMYKNSIRNDETSSFIESILLTRQDMINNLAADVPVSTKNDAIDAYLPLLYKLYAKTQNVQKECVISYEWRVTIANQGGMPSDGYFKNNSIIFELFMTLFAKAITLNNLAGALLKQDVFNFIPEAGKHYLAASGIMTYLSSMLTGSVPWVDFMNDKKVVKPLEITTSVCNGFALLFKASAQALSVVKVLGNEAATPVLLRAKLCVGVFNTAVAALTTLGNVVNAESYFLYLLNHIAIKREVFAALTQLYTGLSQYDKGAVGTAIAHCKAGKPRLLEQGGKTYNRSQVGLPKFQGMYADLNIAVRFLISRLEALNDTAEKDNQFVHFQTIPAHSELVLPPEISVMNPVAYQPPEFGEFDDVGGDNAADDGAAKAMGGGLSFVYIAPPTLSSTVFKAFSKMLTSDPAVPAPAGAAKAAEAPPGTVTALVAPSTTSPPSVAAAAAVANTADATNTNTNTSGSSAAAAHDDEAMARALQAQYDKEGSTGSTATAARTAPSAPAVASSGGMPVGTVQGVKPQQPPTAFTVVVPEGCSAGSTLTVMSPTGTTVLITVPAGYGPGSKLIVQP